MTTNLFAPTPPAPEEHIDVLFQDTTTRIERIVSWGHTSPHDFWYDQAESEWVTLLHGTAILRFQDGDVRTLSPGDHVLIPAHRKHQVDATAHPTIWLCVFSLETTN